MLSQRPSFLPEPLAISKACVMGASGLLGTAVAASLRADGIDVVEFSRRARGGRAHWDPEKSEIDAARLEGADAIVNLAGEGLDSGRWSEGRKRRLWTSRVSSTALLARTVATLKRKPAVLLNASAVGFYGDRGEEVVDEHSPAGHGYLADLCQAWEQATAAAQEAGVRVVMLRFGIVLTPRGGALAKLLPPFRLGLGGRLGRGGQGMPWIALADAVNVVRFVIGHKELRGPVNVVAPETVRNADLTESLGRALGRPTALNVPSFALRAIFGSQMAQEMLLEGALVRPRVLEEAGYRFDYPRLDDALDSMLRRNSAA
jgi:hypothetical protein